MRILLVRLSSFGDVLFTLPAAKALHVSFPGSTLAWAIEEPLAPLVEGADYVGRIFLTRTRTWRRVLHRASTRREIHALLEAIRDFGPDLVVDAQGLFKSAWLTFLSPAGRKVGFGPRVATERVNCLVTDERVSPVERPHVVDRALALAEHVTGVDGFARVPDVSHLVRRPAPEVDRFVEELGQPYALLQPFSSARAKELPMATSAALARLLSSSGLIPVFRWGPGERERAEALAAEAGAPARIAPPTDPAATARLAAHAALFVGMDTGPTHLAAAAGTPTLALFGPTDPARFGPVGERCRALAPPSPGEAGRFLANLSADEVLRAAQPLLSRP